MSLTSSPGGTNPNPQPDPPIGTTLVVCGETVTFAGRTDSGAPIFQCQPQSIPSDEPEDAEYRFDAGTPPEIKLREIQRGTERQFAHARRMPAGPEREWTLASARRGRHQAREIKAREIKAPGSGGRTLRTRAREQRSQRRSSSSSSTSSADPGESGGSDDPPAPARLCAAARCGNPVYGPAAKIYCGGPFCNRARAAERQRQRRDTDLTALERDALARARLAHYLEFAAPRQEHSQSFLWKFELLDGDDPGERDALAQRTCRCNGHHIDGGIVGCFRCGLSREAAV